MLGGVKVVEQGLLVVLSIFVDSAEVVVCAHTLALWAVRVVVCGRESDKRVGSNIYIVFIQRGGVENSVAGAVLRVNKLVAFDALNGHKRRVGGANNLLLCLAKQIINTKGLAAAERNEGKEGEEFSHKE
jgi:hypothetical protein